MNPRQRAAICWPLAGTVGHITVSTPLVRGHFPASEGADATACCDLLPAGKYRNGAARSWCRTHQHYWGVKADLAALAAAGERRCALHAEPLGYVLDPLVMDMALLERLEIVAAADGAMDIAACPQSQGPALRYRVRAFAIVCPRPGPFQADGIVQVNVTPPALHSIAIALQSGNPVGCVDCARCGHPHLDLGDFAARAHRRHYCGNCGHDATHSGEHMISNPLFALQHFFGAKLATDVSIVHAFSVL